MPVSGHTSKVDTNAASGESIDELRSRAERAEETRRAISAGEVDAPVVSASEGDRVLTLRGADERYRILLEQISEGAASVCDDGVIMYANRRLAEMLGLPVSGLVGLPVERLVLPEQRAALVELFSGRDGQRRSWGEFGLVAADGHRVEVHLSIDPVWPARDSAWSMVATDITATRRICRGALSALSDGVVVQDQDGAIISCNPEAERILGLTMDQMTGATPVDPRWRAVREDGSPFPREESAIVTLRSGRPLQDVIIGVYKPDGSLRWISINSVPFRAGNDGAGEEGVVTSFTDVTERRLIEADLRASEELFRTGVGALLDGFAICSPVRDEDGEIIDFRWEYANDASCRRNRLTREQMIGHRIGEVIPGYPASKLFEQHRRVAQTGEAETVAELWFEGEWAGGEQVSTAYEGTVVPLGSNIIITARDITERKLAEIEFRRLAAVVESSADAILSMDREYGIATWNRGAEHLYGYAASEIVGQPVSRLVAAERAGEEQAILTRVLGGEDVEGYETQRLAKDGTVIDVWITVSPIRNAAGEVIGASSIHRDITEQKRVREELSKSEALLRGGFDHSPIGMMLTNLDGTFDRVNGAFARMLGYDDPAELAGVGFASLTHPDDVPASREGIRAMLEQDVPYLDEKRYLRRDGGTVHVIIGSTAVRDPAGNPIAFFTQVEDVTERKQAEAALRVSEERFRRGFENSPIGMALTGLDGNVVEVNATFARMLGYETPQELEGVNFVSLTHSDDVDADLQGFRAMLEQDQPYLAQKRYLRRDGATVDVIVASTAVRDSDGHPVALFTQVEDITDREQAEQELRLRAELLDLAHDAVIVRDPAESRVTFWNREAQAIYGYSRAEAVGQVTHGCSRRSSRNPDRRSIGLSRGRDSGPASCATPARTARRSWSPVARRCSAVRTGRRPRSSS